MKVVFVFFALGFAGSGFGVHRVNGGGGLRDFAGGFLQWVLVILVLES